jgi:hypothetical protein
VPVSAKGVVSAERICNRGPMYIQMRYANQQ